MTYVFTKDLETGESTVDEQHKELFKAINDLITACNSGHGREKIAATLDFLQNYTVKHFSDEQKLHTKHKYSEKDAHKRLHDAFIKEVQSIKREYLNNGESIVLLGKVNNMIGKWLVSHIKREDKKFGVFLKESKSS